MFTGHQLMCIPKRCLTTRSNDKLYKYINSVEKLVCKNAILASYNDFRNKTL